MDEKKNRDSNTTMIALAALMFFSPFIQYLLKKWSLRLDEQERTFVRWYIKLGAIHRLFLILTIASGVAAYFVNTPFLRLLYAIFIGILLILLIVWTICVLTDVSLFVNKEFSVSFYAPGTKLALLLKFLPFYNIYARYHLHSFWSPNRWLKESLLWQTFFVLLAVTGHPLTLGVVFVLWILRISSLLAGIDVLHIKAKQDINAIFFKNPEEIRWYVTWTLAFCYKKCTSSASTTLTSSIQEAKQTYTHLYNVKTQKSIRIEYIIGSLLIRWYIVLRQPDFTHRTFLMPALLLWGRYIIMIITRWHLPSLPVARELFALWRFLFRLLFPKHTDATS